MLYPGGGSSFLGHLEEWVKMQKRMLEALHQAEEQLKKGDRLSLVIASRTAFQHMIKTLKAFDQWLQDPLIVNHMPEDMLREVQEKSWELLRRLLELDIKHTSEFRELMNKLVKEGKISPLLWSVPSRREEEPRRPSLSTTI